MAFPLFLSEMLRRMSSRRRPEIRERISTVVSTVDVSMEVQTGWVASVGFYGSTVAVMVSMTNTMGAICFRAEFCVSSTFSSQAKSCITRVASGMSRSERERFDALSRGAYRHSSVALSAVMSTSILKMSTV